MDWVKNGALPRCRKITGCEAGIENEEKYLSNGMKTKFEDPKASPVRAIGRRTFHRKEDGVKRPVR